MLDDFFKPYKDSMLAHVFEIVEILILLFVILWVQTGVTSGTSEYDIVDFTWKVGFIALFLKGVDFLTWFIAPDKESSSPLQTIGFGTGWRVFWGSILGIMSSMALTGGTNLSFFSTFLQFNNTYMFWFLVVIGPRIEEMFSNTIHPTASKIIRILGRQYGHEINWFTAGTLSLLLIVAPAFAGFHYFTYFSQSRANPGVLMMMMLAAYIFRCIFTIGNYVFRTDEYGKFMHMTHNFIGYWVVIGNPIKVLPEWQIVLIFLFIVSSGLYYSSYIVFRIAKYGFIRGMTPDTIFETEQKTEIF